MRTRLLKIIQLITITVIGVVLVATVVFFVHKASDNVITTVAMAKTAKGFAYGVIPPPDGHPKLSLSTMVVSPTLADTQGEVLRYSLEIINTGAYTATDVTLADALPAHTSYNGDAWSSSTLQPELVDGVITWQHGEVGFDSSVEITFSVTVSPGYAGIISNTAVINAPEISKPVTLTAETRVTDDPIFDISKSVSPEVPGKNKPLNYEIVVTNNGQSVTSTEITVMDVVPGDTTFISADPDGLVSANGEIITWTRSVSMDFGDTSTFTFSVLVGDVASGTIIHNGIYLVSSAYGLTTGEPITSTVLDPIFSLSKSITPDPPGSNSEMTYELTVLNQGSLATDLVISDTVPAQVIYKTGGDYSDGVVTWQLPSLDTGESAQVTFTVDITDVAGVIVLNDDYVVCSSEGICEQGMAVSSLLVGPTFEATAILDPVAKGTGGGTKDLTPTLTVKNMGPGNALDATVLLTFGNISVSNKDEVKVIPPGTVENGPPCQASYQCRSYVWTGNVAVGEVITFTTYTPQSTIGGGEGTPYTATVVVTDSLGSYITTPVSDTAVGKITHLANLIPTKMAPAQVSPGGLMTYTIQVLDSAYTTEMEPPPILTETLPTSVTLVSISDGGLPETVDGQTVISWTLPAMGPGETLFRSFVVQVITDVVSGTLIVNDDYRTTWFETEMTGTMSNPGMPITTTVHEVGLIDSYKTVSPTWAMPGTGTVLTYVVHVVNSGPYPLSGVQVSDIFPWENSTYQRDATATAGNLISDIVSLQWAGDIPAYSEQLITFTTQVDDFFKGVLTNTATISHPSLTEDKVVTAVAYITDEPVLSISKTASPEPVVVGEPLLYEIAITNHGNQATQLVVTDTLPALTSYISGTASAGGELVGNIIQWKLPVLKTNETINLTFQVTVLGGDEVVNAFYMVSCAEGVSAYGEPVTSHVTYPIQQILLPLLFKN